jgi:hypothetical protein
VFTEREYVGELLFRLRPDLWFHGITNVLGFRHRTGENKWKAARLLALFRMICGANVSMPANFP